MQSYLAYWRRGWWAWLMMLCANLITVVIVAPLAVAFGKSGGAYWGSALIAWMLLLTPVSGWLFESFADGSNRLRAPRQ